MPFNIDAFKTNIANYGVIQTNRFRVLITPPPILQNTSVMSNADGTTSSDIVEQLTFRGEAVRIPGVQLQMTDVNRYGYGPPQKQPYNVQFQDTAISFVADKYGAIWQFWYSWVRTIFQFSGNEDVLNGPISNSPAGYTLKYKDDYASTMQFEIYDTEGNLIQIYNLNQAFPTSIQDIPLAWGDDNSLVKINVGITFRDHSIQGVAVQPNNPDPSGPGGFINNPTRIG